MSTKTINAKDFVNYESYEDNSPTKQEQVETMNVSTIKSSFPYDRGSDIAKAVLKGLKQKQIDDEKRILYEFLALIFSGLMGFGVFILFFKLSPELSFITDIVLGFVVGIILLVVLSIRISNWYYSE